MIARLPGRHFARRSVTDAEQRARMLARGLPEAAVNITLGLFAASRNGEFSAVDPALESLLGRPPVSVRELLRQVA